MTVRVEFFGGPALGPRQGRHDNCGSAGDDQPERAGTGTISPKDGQDGIHRHVGGQREESEGDGAKRPALPGSVRSAPSRTARRWTRTTVALTTSMAESRPKATNATEPATMPLPTVTAASSAFQPIVEYSRRTAVRADLRPTASTSTTPESNQEPHHPRTTRPPGLGEFSRSSQHRSDLRCCACRPSRNLSISNRGSGSCW